jgi:hypothetical protein
VPLSLYHQPFSSCVSSSQHSCLLPLAAETSEYLSPVYLQYLPGRIVLHPPISTLPEIPDLELRPLLLATFSPGKGLRFVNYKIFHQDPPTYFKSTFSNSTSSGYCEFTPYILRALRLEDAPPRIPNYAAHYDCEG